MSLFGGTIFLYQSNVIEDIIRVGLALALQIGIQCEENLGQLLSYFSFKMGFPSSRYFGGKIKYSSRFERIKIFLLFRLYFFILILLIFL